MSDVEEEDDVPVLTNIFTPRAYQVELFDAALKDNRIICLGTGTGKTYIAAMLIKESSHQVIGDFNNGAKRTAFLVNTVPLVNQQAKVIKNHTNLDVGEYIGAMNVDLWSKEVWLEQFKIYQVLVMTSEIFRSILSQGFVGLSQFNLIIFDECHHAVKSHPFREIMRFFDVCPPDQYPKILGLTASILNGKLNPIKLEGYIKQLELTLRSLVITASEEIDLLKFGTKPEMTILLCFNYEDSSQLVTKMCSHLNDCYTYLDNFKCAEKLLKKERSLNSTINSTPDDDDDKTTVCSKLLDTVKDIVYIVSVLGPWCANCISNQLFIDLEENMDSLCLSDMDKYLYLIVQSTLQALLTLYKDYIEQNEEQDMLKLACPKITRLLSILKKFKPPVADTTRSEAEITKPVDLQNNLCGIVFVERRTAALILNQFLEEYKKINKDFEFLQCNFVVGHGTNQRNEHTIMQHKKQVAILKLFRHHKLNLLIATSVVEEGVDIPKCNLVIRFDLPKEYRAYIQSKGRARASNSKYIMLVSRSEHDVFIANLKQFIIIEKLIDSKCHNREILEEMEIQDYMDDEVLEPYMPVMKEGGARVSMSSAISLVNRYCSKLPRDSYTPFAPKCLIEEITIDDKIWYMCCLTLPSHSPLRDPIWGTPMKTKRLAKKAAALQACELLHKAGELNDNLLPVEVESIKYEEEEDEDDYEEEKSIPLNAPRPGSTKRRQVYDKKIADALSNCYPSSDIPSYLYVICLKLISEEQNSKRDKIYPPEDTPRCFGILTSKEIPQIPKFFVFQKSATFSVELNLITNGLIVNSSELKILENFHDYVFTNVLQLKTKHWSYAPCQASQNYLIIPLNKDDHQNELNIDWEFATIIYSSNNGVIKPMFKQCQNFEFDNAKYDDAVVMPCYRHKDYQDHYYVKDIRYDLNPRSQFITKGVNSTYENYFKQKYNVDIFNLNQPLLGLTHVPFRLNKLTSGQWNKKGKLLQNCNNETQKIKNYILIPPELCEIHLFTASLWMKAIFLPSILYQTNYLLLAEELRVRIAFEKGMQVKIPFNFLWPPFQSNWSNSMEDRSFLEVSASDLFTEFEIDKLSKGILQKLYDTNVYCFDQTNINKQLYRWNSLTIKYNDQIDLHSCVGPSPGLILQAFTMSNANGILNLERLETIGDSFLKYAISTYLYLSDRIFHEGTLTNLRSKQICNRNLYHLGKKKGLGHCMVASSFEPKINWLPPGYLASSDPFPSDAMTDLDSTTFNLLNENVIPDKSIADCVEALIGAYLMSCGSQGALLFMSWLGLKVIRKVSNDSTEMEVESTKEWDLNFRCWDSPSSPLRNVHDAQSQLEYYSKTLKKFEESIGYCFIDKAYLLQALTHASYDRNKITDCYQRLEFLGDAVLDYLITRYLYEESPNRSPGELTELRSALVNNSIFACLAVKYDFHKNSYYSSPSLFQIINNFVEMRVKKNHNITEEDVYGYLVYDDDVEIEAPKFLGDLFESIAGAIYLDSGMSLDTVWEVYFKMMQEPIETFLTNVPKSPISILLQRTNAKFGKPEIKRNGKVRVTVEVVGKENFVGVGHNGRIAKITAAKRALKYLEELDENSVEV